MPSGTCGVWCILVVIIFSCITPHVKYDAWSPQKQNINLSLGDVSYKNKSTKRLETVNLRPLSSATTTSATTRDVQVPDQIESNLAKSNQHVIKPNQIYSSLKKI